MDKYFIDRNSRAEEISRDTAKARRVHFPLCLAIKYGNDVSLECPNFLLNTSKGKVFVETDEPLPEGSNVVLHFYIPPEAKLLSEFKGRVVRLRGPFPNTKGSMIKIRDITHRKLRRLEEYLEEKRHLVDEKV